MPGKPEVKANGDTRTGGGARPLAVAGSFGLRQAHLHGRPRRSEEIVPVRHHRRHDQHGRGMAGRWTIRAGACRLFASRGRIPRHHTTEAASGRGEGDERASPERRYGTPKSTPPPVPPRPIPPEQNSGPPVPASAHLLHHRAAEAPSTVVDRRPE